MRLGNSSPAWCVTPTVFCFDTSQFPRFTSWKMDGKCYKFLRYVYSWLWEVKFELSESHTIRMSSSHKESLSALKRSNLRFLDAMASSFGCSVCASQGYIYNHIYIYSLPRHLLMEAPFSIKGLRRKRGGFMHFNSATLAQILNQKFPGMVDIQNLIQTKKLPTYLSYLKKNTGGRLSRDSCPKGWPHGVQKPRSTMGIYFFF